MIPLALIIKIDAVGQREGFTVLELVGTKKNRRLAKARALAMRACVNAGYTQEDVGKAFNRSHSAVSYALRRLKKESEAESVSGGFEMLSPMDGCSANAWQPIATAPRDETWMLAYLPYTNSVIQMRYTNTWVSEGWYRIMGPEHYSPSHWMPLPQPPSHLKP